MTKTRVEKDGVRDEGKGGVSAHHKVQSVEQDGSEKRSQLRLLRFKFRVWWARVPVRR